MSRSVLTACFAALVLTALVQPASGRPGSDPPGSDRPGPDRPGSDNRKREPELVTVEVRVTALSVATVFLDQGREAGIRVGDRVRLFPFGRSAIAGTVRSVSRTSARVALLGSASGLRTDVRGEVLVPRERLAPPPPREPPPAEREAPIPEVAVEPEATGRDSGQDPEGAQTSEDSTPNDSTPADEPAQREIPEHPPWEYPAEAWAEGTPLLAPLEATPAAERDSTITGRAFTRFDWTDGSEPTDQTYALALAGLELLYTNPFGQGGELNLDGGVWHRSAETEDTDDEETRLLVYRLSYVHGGRRDQPTRWEVGRFLHHEFPELGVIDGAEIARRTDSGSRFGGSLGILPEPTDRLDTGDDPAVSLFYRYVADPEESFTLGGTFLKTWHEGDADRDLLVLSSTWHPAERTALFGTAWVDFYDSTDDAKDESVELTQLILNATQSYDGGHGLAAFVSHLRWPDIERFEFEDPLEDPIDRAEVSRAGVRGWRQISERVRGRGELAYWNDEDDSGGYAELGVSLADLLYDRGQVSLSLFGTEGQFSDGIGWRVAADRAFDRGTLSFVWDVADYEQPGFVGGQEDLVQQILRGIWDTSLGDGWDLSLYAEKQLGDELDAYALGFFLQRRF